MCRRNWTAKKSGAPRRWSSKSFHLHIAADRVFLRAGKSERARLASGWRRGGGLFVCFFVLGWQLKVPALGAAPRKPADGREIPACRGWFVVELDVGRRFWLYCSAVNCCAIQSVWPKEQRKKFDSSAVHCVMLTPSTPAMSAAARHRWLWIMEVWTWVQETISTIFQESTCVPVVHSMDMCKNMTLAQMNKNNRLLEEKSI